MIKAGREGSGINDFVWIGKAVPFASKFSNIANKGNVSHIVITENIYLKEIETLIKRNTDKTEAKIKGWFKKEYDSVYGIYYHASVTKKAFDSWIDKELN